MRSDRDRKGQDQMVGMVHLIESGKHILVIARFGSQRSRSLPGVNGSSA
jgi:hypothetical protein